MDNSDNRPALIDKLDNNYNDYLQKLIGLSSIALIGKAEEITAAKLVYAELKNTDYGSGYTDYLLKFKNPLEVVRDAWMEGLGFSLEADMLCVLGNITDTQDEVVDYELDPKFAGPDDFGRNMAMQ